MIGERLRQLRKEKGITLEELAEAVGTSKQTIHRYENGVIANVPHERISAMARALGVSPSELMGWAEARGGAAGNYAVSIEKRRLPLLGKIACGEPIYAEQEYEEYVYSAGADDADFCLKAEGDSMIGARIHDGDVVFIRSQEMVDNGEIAAVIINDEATLKRVYFYPEESKLILTPENPKYAPLVYMNDELNSIKILGKAVAFQSRII